MIAKTALLMAVVLGIGLILAGSAPAETASPAACTALKMKSGCCRTSAPAGAEGEAKPAVCACCKCDPCVCGICRCCKCKPCVCK